MWVNRRKLYKKVFVEDEIFSRCYYSLLGQKTVEPQL